MQNLDSIIKIEKDDYKNVFLKKVILQFTLHQFMVPFKLFNI